jgi:tetratricopeptide (TPR) repeat protein
MERESLDADLKARFEARKFPNKKVLDRQLAAADAARGAGDWSAAVRAMEEAIECAPEDPDVIKKLAAFRAEADRALAPKFLEQAKQEEKSGRYDLAARSYERAAKGKASAELFERAAQCLLRSGNLNDESQRKLIDLARKSVTLDNGKAGYRLTLARAYDRAAMRTSALGELKRALELEPNSQDAKELQKSLK